jgi:putative pyruvate formate lyase activating enzyme
LWRLTRPGATSVTYDEKVRHALGRYFRVARGELPAKFMISRTIGVDLVPAASSDELLFEHRKAMKEFRKLEDSIRGQADLTSVSYANLLDLKLAIAGKLMEECTLCERGCRVNRLAGQRGVCKAGTDLVVSSMFNHYGEEPELVPSFAVFTMGCSFHCLHCQNYTISQWLERGEELCPGDVAAEVDNARRKGSRNLNCVGGNPDQYLWSWLKVFGLLSESIPIVWNSNAYYSADQAELLDGVVDVYLLDFKYGNDDCAKDISGVDHYLGTVTRNHMKAKAAGEVIVRVLVLPNHLDCCLAVILGWISDNLGKSTRVNLMWQYRPEWKAFDRKDLSRRLSRSEMVRSLRMAKAAGLDNVIT